MDISIRGEAKPVTTTLEAALVADHWNETEMVKLEEKYKKLSDKILSWEEKRKKKTRRKLEGTEGHVEKRKMNALYKFREEVGHIEKIAADARGHAKETRKNEELKVREKANMMRATGRLPPSCF
ncbi:PREDICTED: uncharacterized protein At3g61260 isoform X2 [Tarenaya hassleriana]|uniref:uncharacterized protein At3g61260 isoform X2 n=1 Tax=Tarenaya hassleriana TaxID=28532 RepID=UPI00053C70CB|nr:PREDICTED: uncharacterized protein At3g61260 isoform X2 [Tarenaya hassleriana]